MLGRISLVFFLVSSGFTQTVTDSLQVWCVADSYATGALTSIDNLGDLGGTFDNAGGAQAPSNSVKFNGHKAIFFDGDQNYLYSSLSASSFNFLHDTTATTVFLVFDAIYDTVGSVEWKHLISTAGSSSNHGYTISQIGVEYFRCDLFKASAGNYVQLTNSSKGTYKDSTLYVLTHTYDYNSKVGTSKIRLNGVEVASEDPINENSTSDATYTLYLGKNPAVLLSGESEFYGFIAELRVYNRLLTDQEIIDTENELSTTYGVGFTSSTPTNTDTLIFDNFVDANTTSIVNHSPLVGSGAWYYLDSSDGHIDSTIRSNGRFSGTYTPGDGIPDVGQAIWVNTPNVIIQADLRVTGNSGYDGLVFRAAKGATPNSFFYFYLEDTTEAGDDILRISSFNSSGTETIHASTTLPFEKDINGWYRMQVTVDQDSITGKIIGAENVIAAIGVRTSLYRSYYGVGVNVQAGLYADNFLVLNNGSNTRRMGLLRNQVTH